MAIVGGNKKKKEAEYKSTHEYKGDQIEGVTFGQYMAWCNHGHGSLGHYASQRDADNAVAMHLSTAHNAVL